MPAKKKSKTALTKQGSPGTKPETGERREQALAQVQAERDILTSIAKALVDQADYSRIGQIVGEKIQKFFGAEITGIALYDEDAGMISVPYYYEKGKLKNVPPFKYGEGVASYVIKNRKAVYVQTAKEAEKYNVIYSAELPAESMIMTPILLGKRVLGALSIQDSKRHAFGKREVEILTAIANNMAVALENARLFNETSQRNAELAVINSVQAALADELDIQAIYDKVGEKLREIFKVGAITIEILDFEADTHSYVYAFEDGKRMANMTIPISKLSRYVWSQGNTFLMNTGAKEFYKRFGHKAPAGKLPKSVLSVKLPQRGKQFTAIVLMDIDRENAFTQSDVRLLQTLAGSMAVALDNAQHFDETTQRNAELAVINSVQEGLSRSLKLQEIIDLVGEKVGEIFHADTTFAGLYDEARDWGTHVYYMDGGKRVPVLDGPVIRPSLAAHVADTKKPLLLGTKEEGEKLGAVRVVRRGEDDRNQSVLGVPILKGQSVIGGISVQSYKRNAFTEADLRLLQTLAGSMSVALQNAQLFDETTQRNAELAVINSVQGSLAKQKDIAGIYEAVGEKIREIFDAQVVLLATLDQASNATRFEYLYEKGERLYPEPAPTISKLGKHLLDTKQTLLINEDVDSAIQRFGLRVIGTAKSRSAVFVPLFAGRNMIGFISLQNLDREHAFSPSDVRLLETLANAMSVSLENARLFNETTQRNAELAVINSVQEGLSRSLNLQEIVDLVGEQVGEIFQVDTVMAGLYDEERDWGTHIYYMDRGRRVEMADTPTIRPSLSAHVVDTKKPLLVGTKEESQKLGALEISPSKGEQDRNESNLMVPIMAGEKVIGIISVQSYKQDAFSNADLRLLQTLAGSMSVALQNAQLFDETTQRNAELAVINSVQEAMAKQLDIKGIYEAVGEKIKEIFKPEAMILGAFNLATKQVSAHYFYEKGERFYPEPFPFSGLIKHMVTTQKSVVINENFAEKQKEFEMRTVAGGDTTKSGIFVPLVTGGKVIGGISLQSDHENAFSESDVRLLETLANGMSVALENARLFDETAQRNAELAIINSVQEGIASKLDVHAIYELVGEKLGEVFPNADVTVGRYEPETDMAIGEYVIEHGKRIPIGAFKVDGIGFIGELVRHPHTQVINENMEQAIKDHGSRVIEGTDMAKSFVNVPLVIDGALQGLLQLQDMNREHAFSESDVRLLETIASGVSVALENAHLFDETQRLLKETEQRAAELAVINSAQEAMAQQMDIQGIYEAVGEKVKDIFDAQSILLGTYDAETELFTARYAVERGERLNMGSTPWGKWGQDLAARKTIVINEGVADLMREYGFEQKSEWGAVAMSAVFVALSVRDKMIGAISLQNVERENAFTESDVRLLETLANSMSVALENARLFDETAQRNAELAIINSVQEGLASKLEIQSIIDLVGEKLGEIFPDMDVVQIHLYDRENDLIHIPYIVERGEHFEVKPRKPWGARKVIIASRQPYVYNGPHDINRITDLFNQYGMEAAPDPVLAGEMPKSAAHVPLIVGDQVKGIISLQSLERENAFPDSTVQLLTTLANSMSVALENARLFDETTQRAAELAVINSVQEGIASKLDAQGIYELVGEKLREVFHGADVMVGIYDPATDMATGVYLIEHGKRLPAGSFKVEGKGFIGEIVRRPRTLVVNANMEQAMKEYDSRLIAGTSQAKSFVIVPFPIGDVLQGALQLQDMDKEHAFSESDVRLLETIANSVSVALENAHLFDETQRLLKESEQRAAELAVINSVQEGLASSLEFQEIIDLVGEKVGEIFHADTVAAGMYDARRDWATNVYYVDRGRRVAVPDGPLQRPSLSARVVDTKEALHIGTAEESEALHAVWRQPSEDEPDRNQSLLMVPILAGEKVIGTISVQSYQRNAYTIDDLRLLQTLASSMSVALENARLFDETAQRNAELSIINAVQEGLASKLEIAAIIDLVGGKLGEIFPDMDAVQINLFDAENNLIHIPYCVEKGLRHEHESRRPWGIRKLVIASRQAVVNNGPQDNDRIREMAEKFDVGEMVNPVIAGERPESVLFVPLLVGDQVRGIISLQNMTRENAFSDSTVQLLTTLANSMSVALENARLFDETERLLEESRKKEEELSTVNTVGQAVASELELASLIELIGVQVRKIFKADIAYVALYNEEKDLIEFPYLFGDTLPPLKMGEGVVSQVIQGRKPVLINRDAAWKETEEKVARVGIHALSYLGVPILVGKRAIGAISVQSTQKTGRFDDADAHLLSTIAANVGAAIENARLFAEVARQKEYFETFFEYSPAAVVVVDFNGTVISWNPAAQNLFGYTAEEAIGRNVDSLVANDPRVEAEARMFTKKFTGEISRVEIKGQRTRKDGSMVDVEVKGLPIAVEGKMVGLLVIYHDISEIESARRAAEEANQAKSAFLANMSHELRTPLNAIIGFTRIVRRKGEDALPEKQIENLDKVLVSAEHLLGLINTILDIAKIEAGRMELQLSDFNLDALVDGCLATTQPLVKPGVQLQASLPQNLPQMHSDEEKIRQVLLNLLSNAAKFTHAGSIQVNGAVMDDRISLAVQDSGIGIAPENLSKIFEEFQQADNTTTREYGGTGLGLSISRSLAKLLGGDLTVASEEGKGSTFTLTIPLHLGPVTAAASADGKEEMSATLEPDKPIVLVIDDQPDMFHILQQNLGDAGYQVVGALSGEEGIDKARSLHPFAITLDIMMPRKDGWQVLYELKNDPATKDIPVIILTIVDNKPMGFRLGASDYLVKPLSEKAVLEALERLAKSNGFKPRKLLVVDDDPKVIDMVEQMLDGEDFAIGHAADGVDALLQLESGKPDAILLDLLMPRMDGFQFIDALSKRPQFASIPVIVLTAKSLSNDEQAQLEKSVAAIVQKQGLGSELLIKKIHEIIPSRSGA